MVGGQEPLPLAYAPCRLLDAGEEEQAEQGGFGTDIPRAEIDAQASRRLYRCPGIQAGGSQYEPPAVPEHECGKQTVRRLKAESIPPRDASDGVQDRGGNGDEFYGYAG